MFGEEEEYEEDPRESFYDPFKDYHKKKFDFLDSRNGSVSKHYQSYINSKTMKKRKNKKKLFKKRNDSYSSEEGLDTIDELPGLEVQQLKQPAFKQAAHTYRGPPSSSLERAMSYSPNTNKKLLNNGQSGGQKLFSRNNTFRTSAPHIISEPKINKVAQMAMNNKNIISSS